MCAACHDADGQGLVLAGDVRMAPTLWQSDLLNSDPSIAIALVLKGIEKENQDYASFMAPVAMSPSLLARALSHARTSWGNESGAVSEEQVRAVRKTWSEVRTPLRRAELEAYLKDPDALLRAVLERQSAAGK